MHHLFQSCMIDQTFENQYNSPHHQNKGEKSYDFLRIWINAFNKIQYLSTIKKKKKNFWPTRNSWKLP